MHDLTTHCHPVRAIQVIAGVLLLAVPFLLPMGTIPEPVCGIWNKCAP